MRLLVLKSESSNIALSNLCFKDPLDWGISPSTLKTILSRTCNLLTLRKLNFHFFSYKNRSSNLECSMFI